jgi:hypothetical protein
MAFPRLSVIIPFYNETAFLKTAVTSVLTQGISGVEVIVVNDNPAQFGPDWFAAQDLPAEVTLLHHPENLGLSAARKSGIAAAHGAQIGFLDSDDYFLTDGLADQLALAEASSADLTHASCCITQIGSPQLRPLRRDKMLFARQMVRGGLVEVENAQFITSSWSSLYRRDFLDGNGLSFDVAQRKFEDRLFVLQTVTAARKIAILGRPARVWRRREGSISVSKPDPEVHRLQLQLLEKCLAHMRAYAEQPGVPARFLNRELFNTVSRLIWDVDFVPTIAEGTDPAYAGFAGRIAAMLGSDSFGAGIFNDPVLRHVSRVGMDSRRGTLKPADFLSVHKALRQGDVGAAAALIRRGAPQAAPRRGPAPGGGRQLILHLGMHKTGSTYLQRALQEATPALQASGVLFAQTGLAGADFYAVRPDGFPGHINLLTAARKGLPGPWARLDAEIAASGCQTVILSCENMLMPLVADRAQALEPLLAQLSRFDSIRLVAFARSPDTFAEMYFRELACNGTRMGARSLPEFLVDFGAILTDFPRLFAPFEALAGAGPVQLIGHEASLAGPGHWQSFLAAAGLAHLLPDLPVPLARRYPTPDRLQVTAARMLNAMTESEALRKRTLRSFFAAPLPVTDSAALLSPAERLALVEAFRAQSADFAAARGYAPDLAAVAAQLQAEDWAPATTLPAPLVERLLLARLQADLPNDAAPAEDELGAPMTGPGPYALKITLRPWVVKALNRVGLLKT